MHILFDDFPQQNNFETTLRVFMNDRFLERDVNALVASVGVVKWQDENWLASAQLHNNNNNLTYNCMLENKVQIKPRQSFMR